MMKQLREWLLTNNPRFAYDSYRRFIQMFSDVVLEVDVYFFEQLLEEYREKKGYTSDPELTAEDWQEIIAGYKRNCRKNVQEKISRKIQ